MTWYKNYLSSETQPWARQVQKKIDNLDVTFRSAEVNNTTRDDQLASSLRQVQSAANAASQAALDASAANALAISANSTAISANNTATTANTNALEALGEIIDLSAPGGPTINASNITAGTLSGITVQTQDTGSGAVVLQGKNVTFYNDNGSFGSLIRGGGDGFTNGCNITTSQVLTLSGSSITAEATIGNFTISNGALTVSNGGGSFNGNVSMGILTCNSVNSFGLVSGIGVSSSGALTRTQLAGGGTTGASVTDGGNFVRTSSSQRYKTDIHLLDINLNDLYAVDPKTFKRIEEVEEHGESAKVYPGFIAEELAGTSLDKFVFYSKDEDGNERPEGIHYPELTAALLLAIKDLNARITTLEAQV